MTIHPWSIKGLLLAGTVCLGSSWFGAPARAAQQFGIGIHAGQNQSQIEQTLSAGPFSYRTDVEWRWIEATQGVLTYPASLSSWLDPITQKIVPSGAQPLVVLDYGSQFYDGGGNPTDATGIAAFARYAGFVAAHYKGTISQFEVWNEWNTTSSASNPAVGTASAYVNLLKATYQAIKAANPNAVVIAGAVTNLDTNWINQFIQAGGLAYADAFSLHPYVHSRARRPASPTLSRLGLPARLGLPQLWTNLSMLVPGVQAQAAPAAVRGTPEDAMAWVDQINTVLSAAAGKTVPIYITEIGWATNEGQYGFAPATAAAYLQRFMLMAHTRAYIAGVWWYDVIDDGPDATNYLDRFGLLQQSGARKPAYTALMQIKDLLLAPAIATQSTGANGAITVSGTLANGNKYSASWLSTDDFNQTASSANAAALIASGYGVAASASSASTSTLSAAPLVLVQQ
ncbi:MAG: cellulase family glycosylhydrolase [Steroidobacteraceae bacterium]